MTVKELIGKLQRFDPDAPVFVYDSETGLHMKFIYEQTVRYCNEKEYVVDGWGCLLTSSKQDKTYNKPVVVI